MSIPCDTPCSLCSESECWADPRATGEVPS
jgi:hypothetical protein